MYKIKHTAECYGDVNKIWRGYHKRLTGNDSVGYDSYGNLYGTIAKYNPGFQSEILYIMFEEGYKKAILEMKHS